MTDNGATDRAGVGRIEQLARSDWTDQDLLTKDEARERLVEEIGRTRARLEEVQAHTGDPAQRDAEVTLLARRLNAMESVRNEYNDYLDGK
jgi:predicted dinucleotide-binding enzyme